MAFNVTILGCGSAHPSLRHLGTAQLVDIRGKHFLVDCTEGVQLALRRQKENFNHIQTILLSHLHGDHCLGLVGLIATMGLLGRKAPLHIYAPSDAERLFRPMIDYMCAGLEYEVVFHVVDTEKPQLVYEDRSLTIHSIPMKHRIPCTGYLFREKEGMRHILPSAIDRYEIPYSQINNIKAGKDFVTADGSIIDNATLTTDPDPVHSYAFCSDTLFNPDIIEQIHGVDLLYHEATYGDDKTDCSAKYFHCTARQAAEIALKAEVGKLVIGHFSHRYNDESVLLDQAREVFEQTELADEGKVFCL